MKVKRSKTWHKISKNRLPQDTGGAPRASQNYYVIMGQSIIGILVESFGCMDVQHCVGKEAQIFQILWLTRFVRPFRKVTHQDKISLVYLLHPRINDFDWVIFGEVQNEHFSLLIPYLEGANVHLAYRFTLQLLILLCFENIYSFFFEKYLVFFFLTRLLYHLVALSVKFLLDLAPDVDYFAIFNYLFWKLAEELFLWGWFELFVFIGVKGIYGLTWCLLTVLFSYFVNYLQKDSIRVLSFQDIGKISVH